MFKVDACNLKPIVQVFFSVFGKLPTGGILNTAMASCDSGYHITKETYVFMYVFISYFFMLILKVLSFSFPFFLLFVCIFSLSLLSFCLSACLSTCMSACLPACLPVYLPVCLSVCLSVCPSVGGMHQYCPLLGLPPSGHLTEYP